MLTRIRQKNAVPVARSLDKSGVLDLLDLKAWSDPQTLLREE